MAESNITPRVAPEGGSHPPRQTQGAALINEVKLPLLYSNAEVAVLVK